MDYMIEDPAYWQSDQDCCGVEDYYECFDLDEFEDYPDDTASVEFAGVDSEIRK